MGTAGVGQSDSKQIVAMQYYICAYGYMYICICVKCVGDGHALSVCSFVIAFSVLLHCIFHLLKFIACVFTCVVYACCVCFSLQHTFLPLKW